MSKGSQTERVSESQSQDDADDLLDRPAHGLATRMVNVMPTGAPWRPVVWERRCDGPRDTTQSTRKR